MDVVADSAIDVCDLWRERCKEALEDCGSEPITMSFVAAGLVSWDSCCGTLVAAPERVYRYAVWPVEGQTDDDCETGFLAVDVVVLLLRCIPTVDDRGNPPPVTAMKAAYDRVVLDAATIWNAVTGELPEGWVRASVSQQFVGDEGGCIGVETRFSIGLSQESWCPCPT